MPPALACGLGAAVGCAGGDGVLDWKRIIEIVRRKCLRDIAFSVECGTPAQAAASLMHLSGLLKASGWGWSNP